MMRYVNGFSSVCKEVSTQECDFKRKAAERTPRYVLAFGR